MNLNYTFYINASLKKIWEIITGEETKYIFYGAKLHSTFKIGDKIQYIGPGRDGDKTLHIYGQVIDYKPLKHFSHTSVVGQVYRSDSPEYESTISYDLEDLGFAVKLEVSHYDWKDDDPSYENTKNNWWLMLSNIKTLAETNKPLNIGLHE